MKVLLVEDDAITAKTVERMIAAQGYHCDTTPFGEDAVALARGNGYDVILLDILLPDIDGYEVLRRMHQAGVRTPVVVQSGIVDRSDLDKGRSLGVPDFLLKPYSEIELSERIETAISRGETQGPQAASDDESEGRQATRAETTGTTSRRQHQRIRTLKRGRIVYRESSCMIDCLILNISEGGAAVQPADFVELPETFLLKLEHGPTYRCEVCWRHRNKLGVRFLD